MSRIKITFMAEEEDREYLRILSAKVRCSQGELLLKLLYEYGETLLRVTKEEERLKSNGFTSESGLPEETQAVEVKPVIVKKFGVDFSSDGGALTLSSSEVHPGATEGFHQRTHEDGWTIEGTIREDYYTWVNDFKASHPQYGRVWGNFEEDVYADSEEGFQHFYANHTPEPWDYQDI